jgi:SAM-dependent methyltransferase
MICASFAMSPRFPAVALRSYDEFQSYLLNNRDHLEARDTYQQTLATTERTLTCIGTCAACLRPSTFSSSTQAAAVLPDGRQVPDWNRQMRCDCKYGLIGRERALIHFLQATALTPWTRLLLFGPSSIDHRLAGLVELTTHAPRLRSSHPPIDAPSSNFHLAVSQDYLNFVPPLKEALAEILRVLVPGGRFVFTIPFQFAAPSSEYMNPAVLSFAPAAPVDFHGSEHKLGWDLLPLLRKTGFRQAAAYLYWSEELGYLGNMNFIFKAVK